jgi:acyl carrier protein
MEYVLGIIVFCVFIYFSVKRGDKQRANTIAAAFDGRESLSPEAFYDKFYRDKEVPVEVVLGVKKILEEHLDADLSKLSANDDFTKNLNFFWEFDSMANVEIVIALEEDFGIKIEDPEAEKTCTVDDIIMLVTGKLNNA